MFVLRIFLYHSFYFCIYHICLRYEIVYYQHGHHKKLKNYIKIFSIALSHEIFEINIKNYFLYNSKLYLYFYNEKNKKIIIPLAPREVNSLVKDFDEEAEMKQIYK